MNEVDTIHLYESSFPQIEIFFRIQISKPKRALTHNFTRALQQPHKSCS